MSISRLSVTNLRNISSVELLPCPAVNLIIGANGSGKTSLLEAIYLLGRARSFKTNKSNVFIRQGENQSTVFGQVNTLADLPPVSVGVSKTVDGNHQIKVAGSVLSSAATLLELLPIQLIEPDTFKLLSAGPSYRRQFVDWGVFHVEHAFFDGWQRLNRCLKQRNRLLRRGKIERSVLAVWDQEFLKYAESITNQRSVYIEQLKPFFYKVLSDLAANDLEGIEFEFYRGWSLKASLEQTLAANVETDLKRGFTQAGPQRADLRVRYLNQNASDVLSRGQQKLVICALKIAQGYLFSQYTGRTCIYLLDDLAAELDEVYRERLCDLLSTLDCQLFITSVDEQLFSKSWPSMDVKVFHVKQGELEQ